jgi:hypothetical protein
MDSTDREERIESHICEKYIIEVGPFGEVKSSGAFWIFPDLLVNIQHGALEEPISGS